MLGGTFATTMWGATPRACAELYAETSASEEEDAIMCSKTTGTTLISDNDNSNFGESSDEWEVPSDAAAGGDLAIPADTGKALEAMSILPSIGSSLHAGGTCKPCAWFWKRGGCKNALSCQHCHLCPEDALRVRRRLKIDALRGRARPVEPVDEATHEPQKVTNLRTMHCEIPPLIPSIGQLVDLIMQPPPAAVVQRDAGSKQPHVPKAKAGSKELQARPGQVQQCDAKLGSNPHLLAVQAEARRRARSGAQLVVDLAMKIEGRQEDEKVLDMGKDMLGDDASSTPSTKDLQESRTTSFSMDELPSVGSALHADGKCRPCAWYWKPQGCANGSTCRHCHLCPRGELKTRKRVKITNMKRELEASRAEDAGAQDAPRGEEEEGAPSVVEAEGGAGSAAQSPPVFEEAEDLELIGGNMA